MKTVESDESILYLCLFLFAAEKEFHAIPLVGQAIALIFFSAFLALLISSSPYDTLAFFTRY